MKNFSADETGQDITEYSLLLAAIILGCIGAIVGIGGNVGQIWTIVNSRLGSANQAP